MAANYNYFIHQKIRLGYWLSLIFFVLISISACRQKDQKNITLVYNGNQATGISVPKALLKNTAFKSEYLQVQLENNSTTILGAYQNNNDHILFKPLIPLSPGLAYKLLFGDELIGRIRVPLLNNAGAASLVSVYPSTDTVPENLLKLYFQFSAPMREGEALKHIYLFNDDDDTIHSVFLNLQPELWNKERTVLTLWLDPGRIKRDLIPNQQLGNPLQKGKQYTLVVSKDWKDAQGLALPQSYRRKFVVADRDSISVQPQQWEMIIPEKNTSQPLKIKLNEPLDYFLLQEAVQVVNEKGLNVKGRINILNKEMLVEFVPNQRWQPGKYRLEIAPHLEDLTGNNIERLFDRDIQQAQTKNDVVLSKLFIIAD